MENIENKSKISLVTPSFNQGQYLEETIISVISQHTPGKEYIIIDGKSTDNSIDIIKRHESGISFWESSPDLGQSHAINKGLKKCSGEIFNWLCSDDYLEDGALKMVEECFRDPSVRIVSGKVRVINEGDAGNTSIHEGIMLDDNAEKTFARTSMTQPVTFWKLEDIRKFGGVNERLHYLMDLEIWFKYLLHYGLQGVKKTDTILANYRVHPGSKTFREMDNTKILPHSAFNIEKNSMFYFLAKNYGLSVNVQNVIKKLMDSVDEDYLMENIPGKPALDIRKAINYYLYDFLRRHYYSGNKELALEISKNIESSILETEDRKGLKYLRRKLIIKKIAGRLK